MVKWSPCGSTSWHIVQTVFPRLLARVPSKPDSRGPTILNLSNQTVQLKTFLSACGARPGLRSLCSPAPIYHGRKNLGKLVKVDRHGDDCVVFGLLGAPGRSGIIYSYGSPASDGAFHTYSPIFTYRRQFCLAMIDTRSVHRDPVTFSCV